MKTMEILSQSTGECTHAVNERGLFANHATYSYILHTGTRMTTERRRYIRPELLNLLDYLVVDEQGRPSEYSMARTLNVSRGGILMETHIPLPKGQQVMVTLGLKDQLIDVMGRIVYTATSSGRHQNGIEFFHVSDNDKRILDNYIAAFNKLYSGDIAPFPTPSFGDLINPDGSAPEFAIPKLVRTRRQT